MVPGRSNTIIHLSGILLPVVLLIFISCNKDKEPGSDTIAIGDYRSMYFDSTGMTIEGSYNNFEEIRLDVDRDDSAELRLVVAIYGSPGMGVHHFSEVQPLDSTVWLYGAFSQDTTFLDRQISIFQDEFNVYKAITNYYNCRRINPSDQVLVITPAFHPIELKKGDVLDLTDLFAPDVESFIYQWNEPGYSYVENDTVCLETGYYLNDCHSLPYGKEIYLGFKLTGPGERLGWLKIIVYSEARLTLKEFAIQEP